uniref:uncharacterized protein LOC122585388 n=1 Tax=Erigeron canadensis TaxID=72917 RepID=UPI001CB8FDF2|nr:uncharacterized protein LOC122585388 [Erigeron canadensis]
MHSYRLKGRSFWAVSLPGSCSWGWRKLLQLREEIRPFIWSKMGNGNSTLAWYDWWSDLGPLIQHITAREISRAGFTLSTRVADIWDGTNWKWAAAWYDLFPVLIQLSNLQLNDSDDMLCWKDQNGDQSKFATGTVWDTLRRKEPMVQWHKVWSSLHSLAGMELISELWDDICTALIAKAHSRSARSVVGRLIVAAIAYFVWQERNNRLFTDKVRPVGRVIALIKETVRLRLVTLNFKNTPRVVSLLEDWKLPKSIMFEELMAPI